MTYPLWFQSDPFRPANSEVGDTEPDVLHLAAGKVLHSWEVLEQSLTLLYIKLVRDPQVRRKPGPSRTYMGGSSPILAAYGSVSSTSARRNMIQAAAGQRAKIDQDQTIATDVGAILDRVTKLSGLRNIVAYGIVSHLIEGHLVIGNIPGLTPDQYFLSPAFYNWTKNSENGLAKIWYSSTTIFEIASAIISVAQDVDSYQHDISTEIARGIFPAAFIIPRQT